MRQLSFRRLLPRVLVATLAVAMVSQLSEVVPAGATAGSVTPSGSSITSPMEYFTNQWNDPMDFNDAADLDTEAGYMAPSGSASISGGMLNLSGVGQIFLLRHDAGGLPSSATRDPDSRTLNADLYTRISFRMFSDRNAAGAIGFRSCDNCADGVRYFAIVPGWHTYDLDMRGTDDHDPPPAGAPYFGGSAWSGHIQMIYMSPGFNTPGNPPALTMDDFRVYHATPSVTVQMSGGSGQIELWQDTNGNSGDDGASASGAGQSANVIGAFPAGSNVSLNAGEFRADQPVRFYTSQSGVRSSESSPVTMASTSSPTPVVTSPSESGGTDFAAEVRGNPWDFSDPGDVGAAVNFNASVHDGQVYGSGATNDPGLVLDLGSRQVDATLYDKLQVTITYQGTFGLADAPGGGMVARVMWRAADGTSQQVSLPMVVETGTHTYVIPLRTNPPTAILDPSNPSPVGWGTGITSFVDMVRFDPDEDPGGRTFQIDDIKLLRDESVSPTFDIHFQDQTPAPGTSVDLYADNDRDPFDSLGTLIAANVPVSSGDNSYTWNGAGVPPGQYWINAAMHRGGVDTWATSTGVVDVGMNGAGPAPGVVAFRDVPSQLQLFFFYIFMARAKFFCAVARARKMTAVANAPLCRLLLPPLPTKKKVVKKRR